MNTENLDDVVSFRNDISDLQRVDDITIKKVDISKKELDKSLFEYEKDKSNRLQIQKFSSNAKKSANLDFKNEKTMNENSISSRVSYSLIENDFKMFCENKKKYIEELNIEKSKQNHSFKTVDSGLTLEKVKLKRIEVNEILAKKLNFESNMTKNSTKDRKEPLVSLKELYKWQPVDSKASVAHETTIMNYLNQELPRQQEHQPETVDRMDKDLSEFNQFNYLYSHFYTHYYNYYFDYFFNQ